MKLRYLEIGRLVLNLIVGELCLASEPETTGTTNSYLSFIPFIRNHPCIDNRYRQLAASLPLLRTSHEGGGHPWRAMYGFCVAQSGKLSLHQDLVISYLDAQPGGDGVSFGTDFSFQWRHKQGASFTPYYELGAGIQYAAGAPFPANGSRWMFTINAGAGLLIPVSQELKLNTAIRYLHLSNGGVFSNNAGYDAFHLIVGMRWGFDGG